MKSQIKGLINKLELEKSKSEEWRIKAETQTSLNEELKATNIDLKRKLQKIVALLETGGYCVELDKENTSPHQHIEIVQNHIEFHSPKTQVPKTNKKVDQKKNVEMLKNLVHTLLN